MGWFSCAEPRKPTKPGPQFNIHRPPASEWVYGGWVGSPSVRERTKQDLADGKPNNIPQETSRRRLQKHDQHRYTENMKAELHQQARRAHVRDSDSKWPTLAEIEAHERYAPRGRNEHYDRGDAEAVNERFETAYTKLNTQSALKGRSHGQQNDPPRSRRERVDPWFADVGVVVPQASKSTPCHNRSSRLLV